MPLPYVRWELWLPLFFTRRPIYARHLNRSHLPLLFPQNVISAVRREEETTEATEAEGGAPKALG